MSGPSDKAVGITRRVGEIATTLQADKQNLPALCEEAVHAAHDPALGLDRSVCLRDVVEALRDRWEPGAWVGNYRTVNDAADFVEREFGGGR
jgi:hypothetical protein